MKLPRLLKRVPSGWRRLALLSTVRGRIIAGFGLLVIILAVVVAGSAWMARQHRSDLAEMEQRSATASLLQEAESSGEALLPLLELYVITGDDSAIAELTSQGLAIMASFQEARTLIEAQGREADTARMDELMAQSVPLVSELLLEVIVLRQSGDVEGARAVLDEGLLQVDQLYGEFGDLGEGERQAAASLRSRAATTADLAFWLLVISGVMGAVLGLTVSTLIARSILRPLSSLESAALAVADGNLKSRARATGPRELARLGTSFNQMTESLLRDIAERKKAEETARHLAYHDALTGLPNRTLFSDRLTLALAQAKRNKQMLAVMFLDLDRFKAVNDTAGHKEGDRLLQTVGEQLKELLREGDTVARMGGDEFTLLLPAVTGVEYIATIADRIVKSFQGQRVLADHEFHITASIGITIFPTDGDDAETLLRNADIAMYRAKEEGRDNFQIYSAGMTTEIGERLALESDLHHALEREEFILHYQPQVDIGTGQVVGTEALVRWQHPERGLVSPMEFIPVAEEIGLIVQLGEWVLRTACAQNKAWQEAGLPAMRVAVNVSPIQFQRRDLVGTVMQVLNDTGLDPNSLEVEITESTAIQDVDHTIAVLRSLRDAGVRVAIDDFGTGHSALSYLKRLPIDVIKIDQSFVRDITNDLDDAALAATVITIAHGLNLSVIAEGVETKEQLAFLKERGCDEMQGYLFSKPMPVEELEEILARGRRRSSRTRVPAD